MLRIAIAGYGNIGKGVEAALHQAPDMEAAAVFTRRDPSSVNTLTGIPSLAYDKLAEMKEEIDVVIICTGSASDLPWMTPELAGLFNVVDSFDNHSKIPDHYAAVDKAAQAAGTVGIISCGWDPGYFSLARLYAEAALPQGESYTFWGRGVSQGHSDAIRRIPGVLDARQYTIPAKDAIDRVKKGEHPSFTPREMHTRDCYVVVEEGADREAIEAAIKTMPAYFEPYDTSVTFLTQDELDRDHGGLPHGGRVIRSGKTGLEYDFDNTIEFKLDLDSNPCFTATIMVAAARAAHRMNREGMKGAKTMLDVPPTYLSARSDEELRSQLL